MTAGGATGLSPEKIDSGVAGALSVTAAIAREPLLAAGAVMGVATIDAVGDVCRPGPEVVGPAGGET